MNFGQSFIFGVVAQIRFIFLDKWHFIRSIMIFSLSLNCPFCFILPRYYLRMSKMFLIWWILLLRINSLSHYFRAIGSNWLRYLTTFDRVLIIIEHFFYTSILSCKLPKFNIFTTIERWTSTTMVITTLCSWKIIF